MHFLLVMAVLAALVVADNCPSEPVSGVAYRVAAAVLGMVLVALFAGAASTAMARCLRRGHLDREQIAKRFCRIRRTHVALWLVMAGAILYGLDWAQMVRFNWHLDHIVLLDDLLVLTPVILPLVLSWGAFYEVERALQLTASAGTVQRPTTRLQYLLLHLRHYLGVLLVPVLGLLTVQDIAQWIMPGVLRGPYAAVVYAPPLALMVAMFPTMLRRTWITSPLAAGPLRQRLEAAARRWGFRAREILVWHTDDMVVNAAVAGFLPRLRYVFLTDALLTRLSPEEIEAVFGHEVGHIHHRHLLFRVMAMLAPVGLWLLLQSFWPDVAQRVEETLLYGGFGFQAPVGLMALCGLGLYVLVVFGAYSRILEAQADLFGYRVIDSAMPAESAETFVAALEKLASANGINRATTSWQHASVAQRVNLVRRAAADPRYERRFHRRVRLLNWAVLAVVVGPVLCYLLLG